MSFLKKKNKLEKGHDSHTFVTDMKSLLLFLPRLFSIVWGIIAEYPQKGHLKNFVGTYKSHHTYFTLLCITVLGFYRVLKIM